MQCDKTGTFEAMVNVAQLIEHRFDDTKQTAEVSISFATQDGMEGKIYLDLSSKLIPSGNNSGRKQCEVAIETLNALGIDLSKGSNELNNLIHKQISVYGHKNDKGYTNFYLNSRTPDTAMDQQTADAKLSALFGTPPPAATQGISPAVQVTAPAGGQAQQMGFTQQPPQTAFGQSNGTGFAQ